MKKSVRKAAMKSILANDIMMSRILVATGIDTTKMKNSQKQELVKDIICSYAENYVTDAYDILLYGVGAKKKTSSGVLHGAGDSEDDFDEAIAGNEEIVEDGSSILDQLLNK